MAFGIKQRIDGSTTDKSHESTSSDPNEPVQMLKSFCSSRREDSRQHFLEAMMVQYSNHFRPRGFNYANYNDCTPFASDLKNIDKAYAPGSGGVSWSSFDET